MNKDELCKSNIIPLYDIPCSNDEDLTKIYKFSKISYCNNTVYKIVRDTCRPTKIHLHYISNHNNNYLNSL